VTSGGRGGAGRGWLVLRGGGPAGRRAGGPAGRRVRRALGQAGYSAGVGYLSFFFSFFSDLGLCTAVAPV
jgi:hypothetical protein